MADREGITQAIVAEAVAAAKAGRPGIQAWRDTAKPFLVLRQRGHKAIWIVKTRSKSVKIGDAGAGFKGEHMNLAEARRVATLEYAKIAAATPKDRGADKCWTWSEMVGERLKLLAGDRMVGNRVKIPSAGTVDDVRRSFGVDRDGVFQPDKRPSLVKLQNKPLDQLNAVILSAAQRGITARRTRSKFLTYARSALTWANSNGHKTGFRCPTPWWAAMRDPDLTAAEIAVVKAARSKLIARKVGFQVEHVGELLARHEDYCASRSRGNEAISPAVRSGLWWICLSANRRGATSKLERENIVWSDPRGPDGWGTAYWDEASMKGRRPFLMPVPEIGLRVFWLSIRDWTSTVKLGWQQPSKWLFASSQRQPRVGSDDLTDLSLHEYSLSGHLARMRGTRGSGVDHLSGVPDCSLHTIRTAVTSFLESQTQIPPGAISAFLDHAAPVDEKDHEAMSRTTDRFYSVSQRMELKRIAMTAWSEAVMIAFEKAGGRLPESLGKPLGVAAAEVVPPRPWDSL